MENRNQIRLFFLLPLLTIMGLVLIFTVSPFFTSDERKYYISEIGIYVKIVKPIMDGYGYIYISQNDISESSDLTNLDCIKVLKSETADISLLVDPDKKSELFLCDRFNFATFNTRKFEIEKIDFLDNTYFLEMIHISRVMVKHPYIDIVFDNCLDSVYIIKCNGRSSNSIKQIY